ncbi:Hypothetical predicted protein [Marmota monax]|uniref:Uncharacterized protein n=1 Tax=Marmota monax TaxID=9995 RepID=A0A5E4B837_MARMO|nr:hypothetical protein GHT09_013933 [Marmota monax]VTJ65009.1 Hypothetical predicted protein [Marmota monax]
MDRQQSPVILGSFKNRSKVSGSPVLCSGEAVTGTSSCCCLLVENSVDLADSHDRHARGGPAVVAPPWNQLSQHSLVCPTV